MGTACIRRKLHEDKAYYNTGSCVHPRCITGIEITAPENKPALALVKWGYAAEEESEPGRNSRTEYRLTIKREVLEC